MRVTGRSNERGHEFSRLEGRAVRGAVSRAVSPVRFRIEKKDHPCTIHRQRCKRRPISTEGHAAATDPEFARCMVRGHLGPVRTCRRACPRLTTAVSDRERGRRPSGHARRITRLTRDPPPRRRLREVGIRLAAQGRARPAAIAESPNPAISLDPESSRRHCPEDGTCVSPVPPQEDPFMFVLLALLNDAKPWYQEPGACDRRNP